MFFIHETTCISAQQTFLKESFLALPFSDLNRSANNMLSAVEPLYEGIPPGILRRMGRAVRLGVGAAMPLILKAARVPDGIIIGTSMGGMEDSIKFLNQIIEYNEGTLTPTNFVQSTPNAIAGQLGLMSKNKGYNITHVHRGFSFENAAIDADMLLNDYPQNNYLIGAVDELSPCNFNTERLSGSYKESTCSNIDLYESDSAGSIAGEGSAMFMVNKDPLNAMAKVNAIHVFQSGNLKQVEEQLMQFLKTNLGNEKPDLLLSGENGDNRLKIFYDACEQICGEFVTVARFKHLCGEHPTASGFGCWIASEILQHKKIPEHMIKKGPGQDFKNILIYNNYKGIQHSFMLMERS